MWIQQQIVLPAYARGCHLITSHVISGIPELQDVRTGLLHVFIQHTSASLTINENADPDVLRDMKMALDRIAPEGWPWVHTCEGPDDMPSHVRSALTASTLSIPITNGKLALGTWQGIYLWEHRTHPHRRRFTVTITGKNK